MLSFGEFSTLLTEKIDSHEVSRDVNLFVLNRVNFKLSVNKIKIDLKAGIRELLNKYINNKDIKIKVRVVYGKFEEGEFRVNVNRKTEMVEYVTLSVILPRDAFDSKDVKDKLRSIITHEMIHAVQRVRSNFLMSISNIRRNKSQANMTRAEYYSEKDEIEAYASETAQDIRINSRKFGYDLNKVKATLSTKDGADVAASLSRIFRIYYNYFRDSSDRSDQEVWKLYLKKVMQHI